MKVTKLIFDQGVCPQCEKEDVMYESEVDDNIERYCTSCDYNFKFKRKEMRD